MSTKAVKLLSNKLSSIESCPKCGNEMDGLLKDKRDSFIRFLSFKLFMVKRYLCYGCLWELRKFSAK